MASTLCTEGNNVILVDTNESLLEDIQEHLDVMTINGNGARVNILTEAGIDKADLLIAVATHSETNILSCQIAKHFNVRRTVCRVASDEYFCDKEGFTPENYGIDQVIFPTDECAAQIVTCIKHPELKEYVGFSNQKAALVSFSLPPASPVTGVKLDNFPDPELIKRLRICAIYRRGRMIIPRGKTKLYAYDELYVAGEMSAIRELREMIFPTISPAKKVIISGVTPLSLKVVELLNALAIDVSLIESDAVTAESAVAKLEGKNIVINGDATDPRILEEIGIDQCDAFISTVNDETSILTCLLAKQRGAEKVYAVADKPDYLDIIAGIAAIDTAFSIRVAAVNELLHTIRGENIKVGALLKRIPAEVLEFEVSQKSKLAGYKITEINLPASTIIAMVIRQDEIISAIGDLKLEAGDRVITLSDKLSVPALQRLFSRKKLL
jgi:trk system potassium uptake protein TrkA